MRTVKKMFKTKPKKEPKPVIVRHPSHWNRHHYITWRISNL